MYIHVPIARALVHCIDQSVNSANSRLAKEKALPNVKFYLMLVEASIEVVLHDV